MGRERSGKARLGYLSSPPRVSGYATARCIGYSQPVTLAAMDAPLDSASQHDRRSTTTTAAAAAAAAGGGTLSVATAMASVAMTVGFIYRSTDAPATTDLRLCGIPADGIHPRRSIHRSCSRRHAFTRTNNKKNRKETQKKYLEGGQKSCTFSTHRIFRTVQNKNETES